jgi:hypothetical protein
MQKNMIPAPDTTSAFGTILAHNETNASGMPSEPRPSGSGCPRPNETQTNTAALGGRTPWSAAGPLAHSPKGTQCSR